MKRCTQYLYQLDLHFVAIYWHPTFPQGKTKNERCVWGHVATMQGDIDEIVRLSSKRVFYPLSGFLVDIFIVFIGNDTVFHLEVVLSLKQCYCPAAFMPVSHEQKCQMPPMSLLTRNKRNLISITMEPTVVLQGLQVLRGVLGQDWFVECRIQRW